MPARKHKNKKEEDSINLLPEKGFARTTRGRVLIWLLSTFRVIVIVTELVVVMAFLSRFFLDAKNNDLTDTLKQKKALLVAAQSFESEFKDYQSRLTIYSGIENQNVDLTSTLKTITSYAPSDIFLDSINISNGALVIIGLSQSERSIQQFSVNLESTSLFTNLAIAEIKSKDDSENEFDFRILGQVGAAAPSETPTPEGGEQ